MTGNTSNMMLAVLVGFLAEACSTDPSTVASGPPMPFDYDREYPDRRPGVSDLRILYRAFPNLFDDIQRPSDLFGVEYIRWRGFGHETWYRNDIKYAYFDAVKGDKKVRTHVPLFRDGDCEDFYRRLTGKRLGLLTDDELSPQYQMMLEDLRGRMK